MSGPREDHAWHLWSSGSEGPALPGARSRDMAAARCSTCLAPAVCPATSGTAACSSPESDCPACISTAHAHLGGATREQHSWAGVSPCAKGDPVGQPSLAIDLTRGLQAPSRAGAAVGSQSRTGDTHALLLVASLGLLVWLAHHLTRTHVGDMVPEQNTGVPPPPPTPSVPSAVPVPVLLCWSGRYLTAGGF